MIYKQKVVVYDLKRNPTNITVALDIDVDAIAHELGQKAFRNRTRKSRGLGGLVVAKVIAETEKKSSPPLTDAQKEAQAWADFRAKAND